MHGSFALLFFGSAVMNGRVLGHVSSLFGHQEGGSKRKALGHAPRGPLHRAEEKARAPPATPAATPQRAASVTHTELSACCARLHAACPGWTLETCEFRPVFEDRAGRLAKLWPIGQAVGRCALSRSTAASRQLRCGFPAPPNAPAPAA